MSGVAGLLLAAGAGRRMGMPKALVTGPDGVVWVVRSARVLTDGGCSVVVVVVGAAADHVRALLAAEPVSVVAADGWADGIGASLRVGLQSLEHIDVDAALVHLVDLPDVGADVVQRLRAQAGRGTLARARYGIEPGHPVILGRDHWAGIAAECAGDAGARDYLRRHQVTLVDCSDLAGGADVDEPAQRSAR